MPKFIVEREMPGAGNMTSKDLQDAAQKSCDVLRNMGPEIQWQESFVGDNKIYCVYIAPNEQLIRQHGQQSGFPVTQVTKVNAIIDPTTAETVTRTQFKPTTSR